MKKLVSLIVVALLFSLVAAFGVGAAKPLKVALLLSGSIDDQGWNAAGYTGLMNLKKELDAEVAYAEKLVPSDYEEVYRGYASQGFDLIIGHAFAFGEAAMKVAKDFPKIKFVMTSSNQFMAPNVASLNNDNLQAGFLAGVVAAYVTKTGIIGCVGAMEVPACTFYSKGYELGAQYINPKIKMLYAITGNFWDAAKAKETALAMVNQRADVLTHLADKAGLGVIEAAKEKKIWAIGNVGDQASLAPNTVVTSVVVNMKRGFMTIAKMVAAGTLKPQAYNMGVEEEIVYLAPFGNFDTVLTAAEKTKIRQILSDMETGKLNVWAMLK